jgi:hypothetical protein
MRRNGTDEAESSRCDGHCRQHAHRGVLGEEEAGNEQPDTQHHQIHGGARQRCHRGGGPRPPLSSPAFCLQVDDHIGPPLGSIHRQLT